MIQPYLYKKSFGVFILLGLMSLNSSWADDNRCEDEYTSQLNFSSLSRGRIFEIRRVRNLLRVASVLQREHLELGEVVGKKREIKRVQEFYQKYILNRYPESLLTYIQVEYDLYLLNEKEVLQFCPVSEVMSLQELADYLFPEGQRRFAQYEGRQPVPSSFLQGDDNGSSGGLLLGNTSALNDEEWLIYEDEFLRQSDAFLEDESDEWFVDV